MQIYIIIFLEIGVVVSIVLPHSQIKCSLYNDNWCRVSYSYSALDAESEYLVQEALERIMVDRTVIVIAHRLSTIRNADNIAVLSQGTVAEFGSFNDLMSLSEGVFKKLVERQTSYS